MDQVYANARLPDGRLGELAVVGGVFAEPTAGLPRTDLGGRMVWPGFVDLHTHLDKGHIVPRAPNPDGTFAGALATVAADRTRRWTADDIRRRFDFALRCAHAHGAVAIRTHLDSPDGQYQVTWPVFAEMREAWRGRIALQGVALVGLALLDDAGFAARLAATVREHGGIMGAVIGPMDDLARRIEGLIRLCLEHGLGLDVHIDETLDEGARSLPVLAEAALRMEFGRPIVVGHCCSLAMQDATEAARTIELMRRAQMQVVSLPMCNMYLQDRAPGRTPRRRGVTLLHELAAAGIPVAAASDNCRDPFYAYGDHDLVEVFREAVRIAHLDHPAAVWRDLVAATPADIMGLPCGRLDLGAPADMVICQARSMNEFLCRPQADRIVVRAGVAQSTQLPSYAELDDLQR